MPKGENNRKLTGEQISEIVRRYTTRLPDGTWEGTSTLAREFEVRPAVINRWLRLNGVEIRSAKESHSGGKRCKPVKNLPPGQHPLHRRLPESGLLSLPGGPGCKCGCGELVAWNTRKNDWNAYVPGHYRQDAPYKQENWLRNEYLAKRRTIAEIAADCGVSANSIKRYLDRFQIPARDRSESRAGRKVGDLNPAWKGGVAKWEYCSDWKALARKIRTRDEWTCQDCGEQRGNWGVHLHVHHIDTDKTNNDEANLISLCARCHRQRHRATAESEPAA